MWLGGSHDVHFTKEIFFRNSYRFTTSIGIPPGPFQISFDVFVRIRPLRLHAVCPIRTAGSLLLSSATRFKAAIELPGRRACNAQQYVCAMFSYYNFFSGLTALSIFRHSPIQIKNHFVIAAFQKQRFFFFFYLN